MVKHLTSMPAHREWVQGQEGVLLVAVEQWILPIDRLVSIDFIDFYSD